MRILCATREMKPAEVTLLISLDLKAQYFRFFQRFSSLLEKFQSIHNLLNKFCCLKNFCREFSMKIFSNSTQCTDDRKLIKKQVEGVRLLFREFNFQS